MKSPYSEVTEKGLRCTLCPRGCYLAEGQYGVCYARRASGGTIESLTYGRLSALQMRSMEAKPFYHFLPGAEALTFSSWGCNLLCPWCQNYHLSRGREYSPWVRGGELPETPPEELVEVALREGAAATCGSFMEPLLMAEYLTDLFPLARRRGLRNTLVTAGYVEEDVLRDIIRSGLDAASLDIKGDEEVYRRHMGAHLQPVLTSLRVMVERGVHVELVYLAVTGISSGEEVFRRAFERVLDVVEPGVTPLHINRYHPTPRFSRPPTPLKSLIKLKGVAEEMGFRFIYIGNTAEEELQWTRCPSCGEVLIKRRGLFMVEDRTEGGRCPSCNCRLPGVYR